MSNLELIKQSYQEDGIIDVTTDPIFTDEVCQAKLIAKETGIIAGISIFSECFEYIDKQIEIKWNCIDGEIVEQGTVIAEISGRCKSVLKAERVALNLMQMMSGVANITKQYVKEVEAYEVEIFDTRKTTPMMRNLMRDAVIVGGGQNHRFNLSDQVLIKDNHIAAAGSIKAAVNLTKAANPCLKIEVECETIEQVKACLEVGCVDIIMLDNMSNQMMTECVQLIGGKAIVEASGNMTLNRLVGVAQTGVDRISVGALTHSYANFDISLKIGAINAN